AAFAAGTDGLRALEVLAAHFPPLSGGEFPVQLTSIGARAGRHGPGCRAGCGLAGRESSSGFGPLISLARLPVAGLVSAIDIAVFIGQDVVPAARRPDFGLNRFGGGPGGGQGGGLPRLGASWPRRCGPAGASRQARGKGGGPGGQPILVPRPIIEVAPFGGQGGRPSRTFSRPYPRPFTRLPTGWSLARLPVDHIVLSIVDVDVIIAAWSPPTAAAPITVTMAPPRIGSRAHRHARGKADQPGDEPTGRIIIRGLITPGSGIRVVSRGVAISSRGGNIG